MTEQEIIRCIDDGANFYVRFFGDAAHMEYHKNTCYSFIRPRQNEHGIDFVFDVHLEGLPEEEQIARIAEIKALQMPVWWDLQSSDGLYKLIHGKDKEKPAAHPAEDDELYMATFADEWIASTGIPGNMVIRTVKDSSGFAQWANAVNTMMFGGYADIHPANHYHWCRKGLLNCYACYHGDDIVAVACVMNNDGICSLEFVATDPGYRRQGLAKAVCSKAMRDAFDDGAKIITLRAINPGTRELYTSLGFRIYNFAL